MAYYTGAAISFAELKTAIETHCVTEGWTLLDGILSKAGCYFKLETAAGTEGNIRLELSGGMGQAGSALTTACAKKGCITSCDEAEIIFPVTYDIHIFNDPDEVYCVINFNADFYYCMAFGDASNVQGIPAPWFGGPFENTFTGSDPVVSAWQINETNFANTHGFVTHAQGMFLGSGSGANTASWFCHHNSLGGAPEWPISDNGLDNAYMPPNYMASLVAALPSPMANTAVLLPLKRLLALSSNRQVIIANPENARITRNDNILPGTVVPYGSEEWKVYPVYRRNTTLRNGTSGIDSGTVAFAIRYTGS